MAVALIVAAGSGERLQAGMPKALVELHGKSLLAWSVEALLAAPSVQEIVVALPEGVAAPACTVGVRGGAVRSESVREALRAAGAGDVVLVHDAARPLLSPELAEAVIAAVIERGVDAAVAAAVVTDTVKRAQQGLVLETLPRSQLWAVQTPQAFRREVLERVLAAPAEVLAQATDDASLIERAGGSVAIVPSTPENLKVTTPLDLELAAVLLARRRAD
ncbi:MAG TPA: 2-C-methyl-D-erythritol 4-phosphate cytidylyltransferase [Solirubrobacteraceae bacterium]|jgi:2-C-methyl-D-erythritol 4-phosphate cytidylyltransferase|nr:2-C-methyl-D-erythritol 4-phosphate cytidylyltransferase [Solirubrobacteraceae bacterium]